VGRKLSAVDQTRPVAVRSSLERTGGLAGRLRQARVFLTEGLFDRGVFWLLAVLVILDIVAAGNIIAWTATFIQTKYGVGSDQAGLVLSASSAGVLFGRLFMGTFVSGRIGDRSLLGICYAAGILMYIFILMVPGYKLAFLLIFLNGAFIAAQAPTMYAIASAKFGPRAPTAIPLIDAIGMLAGFATPALVGALADRHGLHTVLWLIPVVGFTLVLIVFGWQVVDTRKAKAGCQEAKN
jgi:MFS family permease